MKNLLPLFGMAAMLLAGTSLLHAQTLEGVAVNNTGAAPDSSAMLDVTSTDKGVLVSRTDTTTVNASGVTLADGLLIYQTSDSTFYYWDGVKWRGMGTSSLQAGAGATYTTVGGTAAMTTTGTWQVIPGLTQTVTVPANHQVHVSTYGVFLNAGGANTHCLVDIAFYINGTLMRTFGPGYDGCYLRIGAENNALTNITEVWSMTEIVTLAPGTYTIDVQAVDGVGTPNSATLSGNNGSAFQGTFTIGLIPN